MNHPLGAERTLAGVAVAIGCIAMLATMGRAVSLLVIALVGCYAIWLARNDWPSRERVFGAFNAALLIQCVHFGEETWSGFYRVFPRVFGADPWTETQFVVFNLVWFALFVAAAFALHRRWRPAYIVSLFLAIAGGIGNGVGHILLAIRASGYFPGLYTAPLVLIAGIVLLRSHWR